MEEWQADVITARKSDLIRLVDPNTMLLSKLEGLSILSQIEIEKLVRIGDNKSRFDQATFLLDVLVKRDFDKNGMPVYDAFISALMDKDNLQQAPARILQEERNKHLGVPGNQEGCVSSRMAPEPQPVPVAGQVPPVTPQVQQTSSVTNLKQEYQRVMKTELNVKFDRPESAAPHTPSSDEAYSLSPDKPGVALLINIRHFPPYQLEGKDGQIRTYDPTRKGAERDAQYMLSVWEGLGYKIFRKDEIDWDIGSWTKEDILGMIKDFRKYCNKSKPDSAVVFLSSHGEDDAILTSDPPTIGSGPEGEFAVHQKIKIKREVLSQFYDSECPGLKGKPKLFLVNGCQVFASEQPDLIKELGAPVSDMLVVFSQAPGFVSLRNPQYGSWFVHCLTYVMMKCAKNQHLEEMVNQVTGILQERRYLGEDENQVKFRHGQSPCKLVLGATKHLYFHVK